MITFVKPEIAELYVSLLQKGHGDKHFSANGSNQSNICKLFLSYRFAFISEIILVALFMGIIKTQVLLFLLLVISNYLFPSFTLQLKMEYTSPWWMMLGMLLKEVH